MPLTSMTGFARGDGECDDLRWFWEIRTVNSKALDVRCRLPNGFEFLEAIARKTVSKYVLRGHCQLSLSLLNDGQTSQLAINEQALIQVVNASKKLVEEGNATLPTADGLLALRGVLEMSVPQIDEQGESYRKDSLIESLEGTLIELVEMRTAEGIALQKILETQLDKVAELALTVRLEIESANSILQQRVEKQVSQILNSSQSFSEERLYQEAVLLATKADVAEELDRLDAHVDAARQLIVTKGAIGRKFEFLTQEFNREANTLCSKAATHSITTLGLDMKTAIDQIREQVMNIE